MSDRVLVIDSEGSLRAAIRGTQTPALREADFADDLESARSCLLARSYGVVFCDLHRLGEDSGELRRTLERQTASGHLVLTGAKTSSELAAAAIELGASETLPTPTSSAEVSLLWRRISAAKRADRHRAVAAHDLQRTNGPCPIVAASEPMIAFLEDLERASNSHANVLVEGEPGTGKEGIARIIHAQSARRNEPFFAIDCTNTPSDRLERQLFEPGRPMGSDSDFDASERLAAVRRGTLFLDAVDALPMELQVTLARLLEANPHHAGNDPPRSDTDVRFIAASSSDLDERVSAGNFQKELYLALSPIQLEVPALRERVQDIALLADHFLRDYGSALRKPRLSLCDETLERLAHYPWPGNVRELRNVIEHAAIIGPNGPIEPRHLPDAVARAMPGNESPAADLTLRGARRRAESAAIQNALVATSGNRTHAARRLGISHRSLLYKLKEYGIRK